MNTGAGRVK